jgi:hypothetical protein
MPTREEQIVQIDTALRRRFFPLVPKTTAPEHAHETEEWHDNNRLSRALAAYALVGLCELDDAAATGAITDGRDDGGIDALYFDRPQNRLVLVQSKYKKTGAAPSQQENLKTINGIKALQERRFDEFNESFRNRMDEIEAALDTAGVQMLVVIVFLGDDVGPHVTSDLNALKTSLNRLSPRMDWEADGLAKVYGWLVEEEAPNTVDTSMVLQNWAAVTTPRKAVYGQISASALAELVIDKGKALFERNIRHYLGSVGVNSAIAETVRRRPGDFFYLNNGITAVVEALTQAGGTDQECTFGLKNVSIVNGAQTAGAIANAAILGTISDDAKVLITVIEIGVTGDGRTARANDIGTRITRARNHQNVVRGVDFAAVDPDQQRLKQEMAMAGITYHYRPSAEARAWRDDAFTLEQAAIALACLSAPVLSAAEVDSLRRRGQPVLSAVDFVVAAKEVGRLWDQDGGLYLQLFPASLSGLRLCRCVRVFRFIDQILATSENAEHRYYRRMFFRHARYFVMAIIAHRSVDVLDRADFTLSEEDRRTLSRRTDEIAETVYQESVPLQSVKGYLAIFRNLTDAQPLADAVMRRLQQRDAQAQVAPPNPNSPTAESPANP